jgi:hypothetical protein
MTKEAETYCQIVEIEADTLETFFIRKLGNAIGKRTFKEIVVFAKEKTKTTSGDTAVILTAKGGKIVSLQEVELTS